MPGAQGMIQRLVQYTSKLTGSDENQVLRLRFGKIQKGAYKGTRAGRFKHWLAKPFLSKKEKAKRQNYLQEVTETESKALAKALCTDISRRTPVPYEADQKVTVQDVKKILADSKEDRDEFSRTVRQIVSTSATVSQLRKNPMDAARKRLDQALMDKTICHHDQIKQLHREVLELLDQQSKIKKSRRKPLVDGGAPLELRNVKKLKKQISSAVEEKMLSLALFREAEEYAMKEQLEKQDTTPQSTVSDSRRQQLLKDFVESHKPEEAAHESIALLAARHMLENGVEVEEADIPKVDTEEQRTALTNEISRLRSMKRRWAHEVADLLEQHKFKEARIVEDLTRDAEAMRLLGRIREGFADQVWNKHLKKQREKIKRGKKLKTQSHGQKKIHRRGPGLQKVRPQTHFDRVRPELRAHTRVATTHAKQMISHPKEYDGNIQSKEAVVEQTLGMLKSKYPELAQDHNAFQIQEIREYLEKNIHDRRVATAEPVIRVKRPLESIPFSTEAIPDQEARNENTPLPFETASMVSSNSGGEFDIASLSDVGEMQEDDRPQFDISGLKAASVSSSVSSGAFDSVSLTGDEGDDNVFEEEMRTGLGSLDDLVNAEKERLRAKSVSDPDYQKEKDDPPKQRRASQ